MNRFIRSILYLVIFLFVQANTYGQNMPEYHFKILVNDSLNFNLFSYVLPFEVEPFTQNGDLDYPQSGNGFDNLIPITYYPDEDFVGTEEFAFEYRGNPGSGIFSWAIKYSHFVVEVLPSIVEVNPDNVVTTANPGQVEVDVLANDTSTHGDLTLLELTNVQGGTASISADNTILFDVDAGFTGIAYLNYLATDTVGSTALGQLSIRVLEDQVAPLSEEIFMATLNTKKLTILLPANDFQLDSNYLPQNGVVDFDQANQMVYRSNIDFTGQDTFMVKNGTQERFYFLQVYDLSNDGLAVVDDEVYTLENDLVFFNVLDNDFKDQYLVGFTQPGHGYVTHLGNGNFSYSPDEDYHGYDEFVYTLRVAPLVYQNAKVRIGVDNFEPENYEEFKLNSAKNNPVVIDYDVPVDDFYFEVSNDPINGTVTIYDGLQTVYFGCDSITGNNLVVYEPTENYTGTDEFELNYCTGPNNCQLVKIHVEILDEELNPSCPCVGKNCVWKGDTNGDGKVDVRDILPIGFHMGAEGQSRAIDTETWLGLPGDDWGQELRPGINLKHVDCDGNGIINAQDTSWISSNYDAYHTVFSDGVKAFKPFPISISTTQDTVLAGDYLNLTISLGNQNHPIIDFTGLSYNLQFPPDLIDSTSLRHNFFNDSWFANASSTLQMAKQPLEGKVDAAFTRVGGFGASGFGPVASCDFIVENDIEGLKLKSDIIPIKINLSGAVAMDPSGNLISLPEAEKTIYLKLNKKPEAPVTQEVILYPNPAGDYLEIHLNGQNVMNWINVYSATGVLIDQMKGILNNHHRISLDKYLTGMYILEIFTPNGKTAQRFEVIK